jgi:hypothetical protein
MTMRSRGEVRQNSPSPLPLCSSCTRRSMPSGNGVTRGVAMVPARRPTKGEGEWQSNGGRRRLLMLQHPAVTKTFHFAAFLRISCKVGCPHRTEPEDTHHSCTVRDATPRPHRCSRLIRTWAGEGHVAGEDGRAVLIGGVGRLALGLQHVRQHAAVQAASHCILVHRLLRRGACSARIDY